jgi:hypothetical protein
LKGIQFLFWFYTAKLNDKLFKTANNSRGILKKVVPEGER